MELKGLKAVVAVDATGVVNGEWVIPSFFSENEFVGMESFRTCHVAEVARGFDPDACVVAFAKQYPGIPWDMLESMVASMCGRLHGHDRTLEFREGEKVRAVGGVSSMSLMTLSGQKSIQLWKDVDPARYL